MDSGSWIILEQGSKLKGRPHPGKVICQFYSGRFKPDWHVITRNCKEADERLGGNTVAKASKRRAVEAVCVDFWKAFDKSREIG